MLQKRLVFVCVECRIMCDAFGVKFVMQDYIYSHVWKKKKIMYDLVSDRCP